MNLDAPEGTSIFQTNAEKSMAINSYAKLMNKYQSQIYDLKAQKSCHSEFEEQKPVNNNLK
jgi:hypothetical protein